ncbi:MAG: Hsp20/alpha crystallin family protein [Acidovorax sp.]|jgi:HSP20 family molecular chaperone IbpA|uniref:Hsp20/alpha crystallin family protein n=1 Tax=Acidovorax sp. TaxID=1872122 RepID=UPI0025BC42AA|nr:Hsp20/alpha crystallin family protein [Acidovorax sp.]MDH4447296.1 Hsp20/alpha crystallin family protein [Acidovorax sp.]MDH4464815.1 Hsp20/alpha crystallin family protein [Acidovorax sp.]
MIFAPMIPRAAYVHQPRRADVALQRFLMGALANPALEQAPARAAGCTVTQDDKTTTLALDVPGLARDQLQISIEGHTVSVQSVEGAPRKLHRAWELAQEVDASASRARLENGVLTLTLARLEPASKATRLTID